MIRFSGRVRVIAYRFACVEHLKSGFGIFDIPLTLTLKNFEIKWVQGLGLGLGLGLLRLAQLGASNKWCARKI